MTSWVLHGTYQFYDLNEDPVVGGGCHEFEEEGREGEVILGILARQLTDDIHRGRLNSRVGVLELFSKTRERGAQSLGVVEKNFVQ